MSPATTEDGSELGIMFLNEVALGKEKHILVDNCNLKAAPTGYDSVLAVGRTEPGMLIIYRCTIFTIFGKTDLSKQCRFRSDAAEWI